MSIKLSTKYLFLVLLIALAGLFTLGWYLGHKKAVNASRDTVGALKQEIIKYQEIINGKTVYIAQVEQELQTQRELIKSGELERKELKALNLKKANEISRLNLQIDTLLTHVEHNGKIISVLIDKVDSLTNETTQEEYNAVILPFKFQKKDNWLDFRGELNEDADLSIDMKMKVGVDVITGVDKKGKNTISVITNCPYVKPLSVSSFKTDTSPTKRIGIGIQVGWGVCLQNPIKTNPYIGVGISYNLFQF